jgi:hypothetical protein
LFIIKIVIKILEYKIIPTYFYRKYSLIILFVKQKIKKSEEFNEKKLVYALLYAI